MEILKLLDDSPVITQYEVLSLKVWQNGLYFKIKCYLTDDSVLFIREYLDEFERNYSYHWQRADNSLIVRWDNAPHHANISTFPHHKHIGTTIEPSREMQAGSILKTIAAQTPPNTEE